MKQRIWIAVCGILILALSGCGGNSSVYLETAEETTEKASASSGDRFDAGAAGAGASEARAADAEASDASAAGAETSDVSAAEEEAAAQDIYVYVCGAVERPGVYRLSQGSRIFEAIELAGGLRADACGESVNQAETLDDGGMIKVLTEAEAEEVLASGEALAVSGGERTAAGETSQSGGGKVNINTADAEELMTLPGIGASKAESILSYRREHGAFSSAEELMNIAGIKEGVYTKLKDYITVN